MSIKTLKSIVRRGTMFGAAFAVVAATFAPASLTFADALNPLTERSLTLSSSAPGWDFRDGSGNTTYSPPNSGANGKQTGNTFSFKVSSTATIRGLTFQYCTTSAGDCLSPGNNTSTGVSPAIVRNVNGAPMEALKQSDLEVVTATPSELSATFATVINTTTGIPNRSPVALPALNNSQGNFVVMQKTGPTWAQSTGWTMAATNDETGTEGLGTATGKDNFISLTNATGVSLTSAQEVRVIFFATNTNYITNPGEGAFFVKINSYNNSTTLDDTTLVDGGVTVANVMNLSINIQTKVLETMDFSVGTVDPYTLDSVDPDAGGPLLSQLQTADGARATHGSCDPIVGAMDEDDQVRNTLLMGDQNSENSLRTDKTYSTHSYWRLSSNSSGGATVYYSGVTLKNTVGDEIAAIGTTSALPSRGTPQFGLAIANETTGDREVSYVKETDANKVYENGADNAVAGIHSTVATDTASLTAYHAPRLAPLVADTEYDNGVGVINGGPDYGGSPTARFAFDPTSNTIPTPIASQSTEVVDCVTAKMRYIANIAATTPAGIYTTKINYIAAPQY